MEKYQRESILAYFEIQYSECIWDNIKIQEERTNWFDKVTYISPYWFSCIIENKDYQT